MRRLWPILVLLLPGAGAQAASEIEITSAHPVLVEGEARVVVAEGAARLVADRTSAQQRIDVARATLVVWEWTALDSDVPAASAQQTYRIDDARATRYELENVTLAVDVRDEAYSMRILSLAGGTIAAAGDVSASGVPVLLAAPHGSKLVEFPERAGAPDEVEWEWQRGWHFFGDYATIHPVSGFPVAAAATLDVSGPTRLSFQGGNVSFVDADGAHTERTGRWTAPSPLPTLGPSAQTRVWRWAVLEGELRGASIDTGATWGLAGSAPLWEIDGALRWTNASGYARVGSELLTFHDQQVDARGAATISPGVSGALSPARYHATGAFDVDVSGAPVGEPAASVAPIVAAGAGLAALLLLLDAVRAILGRGAGFLYTRLSRDELLEHPKRAKLYALVREAPGTHVREAYRHVGGGWGAFNFHLSALLGAGYLTLRRSGKFRTLHRPGLDASAAESAARNPVAKRILDALPEDGAAVSAQELRAALGLSRSHLNYHLGRLAGETAVLVEGNGRGKLVRRAANSGPQKGR